MIELLMPTNMADDDPKKAEWNISSKQVKFTPLHWLAFWNDTESIQYILTQVSEENFTSTMKLSTSGLTPIDIAGKHQ